MIKAVIVGFSSYTKTYTEHHNCNPQLKHTIKYLCVCAGP